MARASRPASPARAAAIAPALPPLPVAVTAALAAFVGAAILLTVTFPIYDGDVWQHLLVGKAIWALHHVPTTQLWSWPTHGAPDVLPSWTFRVLLWPIWKLGGVHGLFAWRWLTTLLIFGLSWRSARASGARGAFALFALFWCALFWRYRSQPRPDSMVAVLMAAELLVLEARRARAAGARGWDPAWLLVPIALLWANLHLSYWVGFALAGFYLADASLPGRTGFAREKRGTLLLAMAAAAAVSLVNPCGWRTLVQPVEYFLVWRHEPVYQIIGELRPVNWAVYSKSLLQLWLPALALLALRRWRRHGFDLAQALVLAVFIPQALSTQRFLGYAAVLVAPFFARDLDQWLAESAWPQRLRGAWAQAAMAAALVVVAYLPTLSDSALRPGYGIVWTSVPVRACDWIESHGVRGRGFNPFEMGGYLLYRFWPDSTRLPFMDIHQAGTREDRSLAALGLVRQDAWERLDGKYRFDWVLLSAIQYEGEHVLDIVGADTTTWAPVFRDDVAELFLRRDGPLRELAARERYAVWPAAPAQWSATLAGAGADSLARAALRAELERAAAASPWNARANDALAYLDLMDARWADARRRVGAALRLEPGLYRAHERIGLAWLMEGRPHEALAEFEAERRAPGHTPLVELRLGQALQALGRREEARLAYTRALAVPASEADARDSLAAIDRR